MKKGMDQSGAYVKIIKIIIAISAVSCLRRAPVPGLDSFGKPFFTITFKFH